MQGWTLDVADVFKYVRQTMAKQRTARYRISTRPRDFDVGMIHDFLRASYWAKGVPRSLVVKSIRNSLCFGVFCGREQVGFARVITDRATLAYLSDVFIVEKHRGRGLGSMLIRRILAHPDLQGLRRILLSTQNAHDLYRPFGFKPLSHPERFLTIAFKNVYQGKNRLKRQSAP